MTIGYLRLVNKLACDDETCSLIFYKRSFLFILLWEVLIRHYISYICNEWYLRHLCKISMRSSTPWDASRVLFVYRVTCGSLQTPLLEAFYFSFSLTTSTLLSLFLTWELILFFFTTFYRVELIRHPIYSSNQYS